MTPHTAPAAPTPPPAAYPPQQHGGHPHDQSGLHPPQQHGGHPHDQSGLHPPQQQGYPPQQQGYPPQQQGYPPHPGYGHYPQHRPPKGKGKLIAILVVVAALAAGGIVIAVVMSKKGSDGGSGGGGFDSGEALAKATLDALVAGDGDKLVSFTPPMDTMLSAVECPAEEKAKNEEQAKQSLEEAKKKFAEKASQMKGSGATFKKVNTDIGKQEVKAGTEMGPCKAKVTITMTGVGIEHDFVDPRDKSKQEHKTTYGVMILEGKYYLLDVGDVPEALRGAGGDTPPTTPDAPPTTSPEVAAATRDLDLLRAEACACPDRTCADQVLTKRKAFAEKYALVPGVMDDPTIQATANELMKCMSARMAGNAPPEPPPIPPPSEPTPPSPPPAPGKGLPECEAYAVAADRFIKCNKVPKQSRDAVKTAVDTMRKNWGDPATMSEDMKRSAAETCVTLEKSMKDAAAAIGCK